MLTPYQIICISSKRNAMGALISSCQPEKGRNFATLKLMTGLLGKPHLTQYWGPTISMGGFAKKLQPSRCGGTGVVY
jgi:hypothetical protein